MAWLKLAKLCPCLSYFPDYFGQFECLALFRKLGEQAYTKAVKQDIFSQFFKTNSNNFSRKARLFCGLKREDKPNSRYISRTFVKKLWLLDSYVGTNMTTLTFGRSQLRQKQIKLMGMFDSVTKSTEK